MKIDEVDQAMAAILLSEPTITDTELGKRVGLSRQSVNKRRHSNQIEGLVKQAYSGSSDDLKRLLSKSLRVLESCLESPDERIRLAAALPIVNLAASDINFENTHPVKQIIKVDLSFADEEPASNKRSEPNKG